MSRGCPAHFLPRSVPELARSANHACVTLYASSGHAWFETEVHRLRTMSTGEPSSMAHQQAGDPSFLHDAFISYSRKDRPFAVALQRALNGYTPPSGLPVARRRLNVFRDEEDFTGPEYFQAVRRHLAGSRKLIVLCSPHAPASRPSRSPWRSPHSWPTTPPAWPNRTTSRARPWASPAVTGRGTGSGRFGTGGQHHGGEQAANQCTHGSFRHSYLSLLKPACVIPGFSEWVGPAHAPSIAISAHAPPVLLASI